MTAERLRLEPNGIALLGLLTGLLTGMGEVVVRGVAQLVRGPDPMVSADFVWMTPIAVTALFCLAVLPILFFAKWKPLPAVGVLALLLFFAALAMVLALGRLARWAQLIMAAGIALQCARLLAPHTSRLQRFAGRAVPVLVLLVLAGAAGMLTSRVVYERRAVTESSAAREGAPNVLLIILDTVRRSSMSLYGHTRPTTPNLEEFAAGGVAFESAWTTSSWTLPSHGSLFTGRHSWELSTDLVTPLDDAFPTLAEHFRDRGYHTAGFTANIRYANRAMGVARGFARYEDYPVTGAMVLQSSLLTRRLATAALRLVGIDQKLVRKPAKVITDRFLGWQARRGERPFFVFLNFFDAHAPYLPPDSLAERFGPVRQGRALHDLSVVEEWSEAEIAREEAAYEASLVSIDQQLDRLFDTLEERGVLDETVIVITSDHGEQFGEHGLMDHGNSLYRPLLEVPLVIRYPDAAPAGLRIETPVSLRDIAATIADLADATPAPFPGTSLASLWEDGEVAPSPIYAEVREGIRPSPWLPLADGALYSVVNGPMHYILNGDGREELYDLPEDPDELVNLADSASALAKLESARVALARVRGSSSRHAVR